MHQQQEEVIRKLQGYQPSEQAQELIRTTSVVLLVGISGAGKDTIKHHLLTDAPGYRHIVSHTTRAPRANNGVMETDGVDYHFIDWSKAAEMVDAQEFIEAKIYAGNLYGTSTTDIQLAKQHGETAITALEVQGVEEYKKISSSVKAIFLLPPSYAVWQERYRKRYGGKFGEHSEDIQRRMQTALIELNLALTDGFFTFVVNDHLAGTVKAVDAVARGQQVDDQGQAKQLVHELISELSRTVNRQA